MMTKLLDNSRFHAAAADGPGPVIRNRRVLPPDHSTGLSAVTGPIDLTQTLELHRRIGVCWKHNPEMCLQALQAGRRSLSEQGAKFEGARDMELTLSALCFPEASARILTTVAESLHAIVERAIDWVMHDEKLRAEWFSDHQRMWPWLKKSPGQSHWQAASRYDAIITESGAVKVIELNTGCPAGFMHAQSFSSTTENALSGCGLAFDGVAGPQSIGYGSIAAGAFVEQLLALEAASGLAPGLIALVNDENGLLNELALIQTAFKKQGREAEIVPADEITYQNGQACFQGQRISLSYNKIRISTAYSPNDHWASGFENRYGPYLQAIADGALVAVNNLASLTIAEDKGLLQILRDSRFRQQLSATETELIDEHVLQTARLVPGQVVWNGETVDLFEFARENRERLVIKPANEGRGFGVVVGRYATADEWNAVCQVDPHLPRVVQEYVEPLQMPIVRAPADAEANRSAAAYEPQPHFLTVGLAVLNGRYRGLLSRVSANPITNVGRQGIVQAVFVTE